MSTERTIDAGLRVGPSRRRPAGAAASLAFAAAVLCGATPGWGWIDTGHKVIAFIAWVDLTPAARAAVSAILKRHPRYEQDLLAGGVPEPARADLTPDEVDRRAFAGASVWPDRIKAAGHPMRYRYSHADWHFIDIPFVEPSEPAVTPPPPAADARPGPHNAVEALTACLAELKNPATQPDQRAVDVCWIAHLVGDIHQPLHAASMFSAEFPHGDAGGNDEAVLKDAHYYDTKTNLHLLWDSLPGDFASDDLDRYEAQGLHDDPRYARSTYGPQLADADFMSWAKTSHRLAVDDAYLDGRLKFAVATNGGRGVTGPIPGLPPGYLLTAEHVAMRQVTLAGYRLADLLNATLDPTAAH